MPGNPGDGTPPTSTSGDLSVTPGPSGNVVIQNTNIGSGTVVTIPASNGDPAGAATVTAEPGSITLQAGGGSYSVGIAEDVDAVGVAAVSGTGNTVTSGSGAHAVITRDAVAGLTSSTITLGSGSDIVFLGGGGNVVDAGGGDNVIVGSQTGNDRFVTGAAGASDTVYGFSLTNGDKLDLSAALAGTGASADGSNLASFVDASQAANQANTVLTVNGAGGTATITLANTGPVTIPDLVSQGSIVV